MNNKIYKINIRRAKHFNKIKMKKMSRVWMNNLNLKQVKFFTNLIQKYFIRI
jgi:hypothetical protein